TRMLPYSLEPSACVKLGSRGFAGISILPKTIFKKAPTPKKRMDVLKRDKFKCKVCGRRPDNYVDIELHVHHIRPFGDGGFTHEENLITLCDTCHKGLDPHYEWSLYDLLDDDFGTDVRLREQQKYLQEVKRYREARKQSNEI
ncbi:MAG: HNH endonuclease, partial [Nanoarchaeota archaeon]